MTWFGRKKSVYRTAETAEALEQDISDAQAMRKEIKAQWGPILAATEFLADRKDINGFGEELQIQFTPRRRGDDAPKPRHAA